MDRERHANSTQAGGGGITFNKALYRQRYLQRKENEENNSDKQ